MIYHGDCLEVLKTIPDNSVDSCVTDPPYGLSREPDIVEVLTKWLDGEDYHHRGGGFMGKTWDSFVPGPSVWREVYRVLKPGSHLLCFAGTRTQDLMTISLRLAGFEIRDVVEWLYFSGFPKSLDVGKAFDKRARVEREVVGQYSVTRDFRDISGGRYGDKTVNSKAHVVNITAPATPLAKQWDGWGTALKPAHEPIILARKPLDGTVADNVERWGTGALNIDGCRIPHDGDKLGGGRNVGSVRATDDNWNRPYMDDPEYLKRLAEESKRRTQKAEEKGRFPANCVTTEPDAFFSKYFNVTPPELSKKASKRDRLSTWDGGQVEANRHPTVKPTDLMAWLVRLVTPPGGTVLDPFAGSGSTLVAAKREGFDFIGIEREKEYVEIAKARTGSEVVEVKDEKFA